MTHKWNYSFHKKGLSLLLVLITIVLFNCSLENNNKADAGNIASAHAYITELVKQNDYKSVTLDLSNEQVYSWVLNRLELNRKTRLNSPQLYNRIEKLREKHLEKRAKGIPLNNVSRSEGDEGYYELEHKVINVSKSYEFTSKASRSTKETPCAADAMITSEQDPDYMYVDVIFLDKAGNSLGSDYKDGFMGENVIFANARGATDPDSVVEVSSFYYYARGSEEEIGAVLLPDTVFPQDYRIAAPVDTTGDGLVRVCMGRGYRDCDDSCVGYTTVKMRQKGEIVFPENVKNILTITNIAISLSPASGGTGYMTVPLERIKSHFVIDNSRRAISWDIPKNEGVFSPRLFNRFEKLNFQMTIRAYGLVNVSQTTIPQYRPLPLTCLISTAPPDDEDAKEQEYYKMPLFEFAWSCLAEGTMIKMADGSEKKVEKVILGEKILSAYLGKNGKLVKASYMVGDISTGGEDKPMVQLYDSKGHFLLLTETHPVVTPDNNLVYAGELKRGDQIVTETGVTEIIRIVRKPYKGRVYNLKLNIDGSMQSKMPGRSEGATMFANGIMVGDIVMQRENDFRTLSLLDKKNDVSRDWFVDYLFSLMRRS